MNTSAVVYIQSSRNENGIALSSFATVLLDTNCLKHYRFHPPCKPKDLTTKDLVAPGWLDEYNKWGGRPLKYTMHAAIMKHTVERFPTIYVHGNEQAKTLSDILDNNNNDRIIDIATLGCPILAKCVDEYMEERREDIAFAISLSTVCGASAAKRAMAMANWLTKNQQEQKGDKEEDK